MDEGLFTNGEAQERLSQDRTFVLTDLDLYDWGAFAGRHRAEIDIKGTAIIGPTGSGKTTLIDALMTLITASPRYNLASTGGHESDRDLLSYVRGVSGAGNNSGDNEHVARPGAVVTGIAARFSDGETAIRIGALLWLDDSSSAIADLKRRWVFCLADSPGLDEWLEAHHDGGIRALKQLETNSPGLKLYEAKQPYLARLRSFFEVGENAFNLLNRAAGLKQLNSIDDVFRELVLDDRSAFGRATEVADEFNTLAGIRSELETARQQRDSLHPIEKGWTTRLADAELLLLQQVLRGLLPRWFASHARRLWGERTEDLERQVGIHNKSIAELVDSIKLWDRQAEVLQSAYLKAGGAVVEQLRERAKTQREVVSERSRYANEYRRLAAALHMDPALEPSIFESNQILARDREESLRAKEVEQQRHAWALGVTQQRDQDAFASVRIELEAVRKTPASNIPSDFNRFRAELAQHLAVEQTQLPFVAELIEVKSEETRWRGAIERAVGGHRLRLMVDSAYGEKALTWINGRDNRLHVRLLDAKIAAAPARFLDDGFARKLNFKPHSHRASLKCLLANIDLHCVETTEQLRGLAHAMTDQGLMSGKHGYFEKQDQRRLSDDWVTGFDNKDRLASLSRQLNEAEALLDVSRTGYEAAQREVQVTAQLRGLLDRLIELRFNSIDVPGAEKELYGVEQQITLLAAPDSDTEKARREWEQIKSRLEAERFQERQHAMEVATLKQRQTLARNAQERANRRSGEPLDDHEERICRTHSKAPVAGNLDDLDDLERKAQDALQDWIGKLEGRMRLIDQDLVRAMANAQKLDTGALSEVGTELADIPQYLERLRILVEEALPEKMQRFLDYLNHSSDQGVTQLLSDIENEVSTIEERIDDLNATLRRVDFQPFRYLRLEPQRVKHESLRTLEQAQRQLRSAALKDDQGESQYRALQHMVSLLRDAAERRKTLAARALLDPRYRLQFAVSMVDRGSGNVIETRTSSHGGSGGEKEIIASYVLTASLSYALCPSDSNRPLFGTIVLDEAFSKSSQAVAGRIIRALEEFGLHPLFVTPNKELRLLRTHTRSAILIHRKGQQATMTSLSWDELEEHARQRSGQRDEVAG